jgi:hypothetical protein
MTALLSLVEPPETTLGDEWEPGTDPTIVEPEPAEAEAYPADPVEVMFDQWFRLVTAPLAVVAPVPVNAARDAMRRLTYVDELM